MPLDVGTLINDRFFDERSSASTNKGYSVLQADEIAHLGVDILLHNQIGPVMAAQFYIKSENHLGECEWELLPSKMTPSFVIAV